MQNTKNNVQNYNIIKHNNINIYYNTIFVIRITMDIYNDTKI